jgi:hypothetical protein
MMNRSCLLIKVEQVKESLLTRRYFPLGKNNEKMASWLWKRSFPRIWLIPEKSIAYRCVSCTSLVSIRVFLVIFDLIASVFYQHTEVCVCVCDDRTALALSRIVGKSHSCWNNRMMHRGKENVWVSVHFLSSRNRPKPVGASQKEIKTSSLLFRVPHSGF